MTYKIEEYKKTIRLTKLINILNNLSPNGGITLEELSNRLSVSERTIYRDLQNLDEMKIGLCRPEKETGKKGRYLLENIYLPPISPDKALFIYLSLLQQKGTTLTVGIKEIKQALVGTLAKNKFSLKEIPLDKLESRIHIADYSLVEPEKTGENFIKIIEGIDQSKVIRIKYLKTSEKKLSNRFIEPYGLICKNHNWYLIGKCLEKKELRTFRIDQIEETFVKNEKFEYPPGFNIKNFYEDSWGVFHDAEITEVFLLFSQEVAYRLKKVKYHSSQEIVEEQPDGSIIVRFNITGYTEFLSWLLQWKCQVKILKPAWLVEDIKNIVKNMSDFYS